MISFQEFQDKPYSSYQEIYPKIADVILNYVHRNRLNMNKTKILDAASGKGVFTSWLKSKGFLVSAADIAVAQWHILQIKGVQCDLMKSLPFRKNIFDIVVSIETIEHLENPFHLLREFSQILKPGGLLIVSTPNVHCAKSRLKYLILGLTTICDYDEYVQHGHISPVNIGQFLYSFHENKMAIADVYSVGLGMKPSLFYRMVTKAINMLTMIIMGIFKKIKYYKAEHYIRRFPKAWIRQLLSDVTLIVVAIKNEN